MKIQVMGPGCPRCDEAEKTVRQAVEESGVEAEIEKVTDFQAMAALGVFSTPGVAVDGQVKLTGRPPSKNEVLEWLGQ